MIKTKSNDRRTKQFSARSKEQIFNPDAILKQADGIFSKVHGGKGSPERLCSRFASMLMEYKPEVRSRAIEALAQKFYLKPTRLAQEVRKLEVGSTGKATTSDFSPEIAFESLKEVYQTDDPQLIKQRILWRYVMQVAIQTVPGCSVDIKYHNQHWQLCDHVIEHRSQSKE